MAVRKVITTKDSRLREKSRPVQGADKKLFQLIKDLEDTLKFQKDPDGVGLAAPQIGVNLRVFAMRYRGKIVPIINPEILSVSEKTNDQETKQKTKDQLRQSVRFDESGRASEASKRLKTKDYIMEGCLSLPHYYGPVQRAREVKLRYQELKNIGTRQWALGTRIKTFTGFPAQIIQHEVDHLDGKIFVDRLLEQNRKLYEMKGKKWEEVEI